jgi:phospholipase/carboxylesterase
MLETVEQETGPNPSWSVIWLHGLGADGHDFEPVVKPLTKPQWPAIRYVFPHAPFRSIHINGGMRMRAWYDIRAMDIVAEEDSVSIEASVQQIEALILRENARGIPSTRILLAGFSQGGAIALALACQAKTQVAGIMALSTYLPLIAKKNLIPSLAKPPVLMIHGLFDPIIPLVLAEQSQAWLKSQGFLITWHSYPIEHTVSQEELDAIGQWMSERFTAPV